MKAKDWIALAGFVALSLSAGAVGSLFTASSVGGWYALLVRPAIAPPNWVFGPVWTTLYLLMGLAAFLVWRTHPMALQKGGMLTRRRIALGAFVVQLALNAGWSVVFFGLYDPGAALTEIAGLWLAILATMLAFATISRPAAWLLAPYLLWVSFAAYLNLAIWLLN